MKDKAFEFGSKTARAGFKNEEDVADSINNWNTDEDGGWVLEQIGIDLNSIRSIRAKTISGEKSDVVVRIESTQEVIQTIGFQVKLVSNERGFNQIDKRKVGNYQEIWKMPESVAAVLKLYTGEIEHSESGTKDSRRLHADELSEHQRELVFGFFKENKDMIAKTIFKGDTEHPADWLLVVQELELKKTMYIFSIDDVISFYLSSDPSITRRGTFKFGLVTIQRKGGDRGRDSAKMLQFKMDPMAIVNATRT